MAYSTHLRLHDFKRLWHPTKVIPSRDRVRLRLYCALQQQQLAELWHWRYDALRLFLNLDIVAASSASRQTVVNELHLAARHRAKAALRARQFLGLTDESYDYA